MKLALALCAAPLLLAQEAAVFETAAIKPVAIDAPCSNGSMIQPMTGGGLRVECMSLKPMLTWAYQVQNFQISGGPAWVESMRWNIMAKADAAAGAGALEYEKMSDAQRAQTLERVRRRLQALLAERFQLVIRRESREQAVYSLTVAKGGPKLKESENQSASGFIRGGRNEVISKGAFLAQLAHFLAIPLRRPVIDNTGLAAHYDFELHWTPEAPPGGDAQPGPTVFTAIQEQLGLRLEAAKAPVDLLVIERVEKPVDN